MFLVVSTPNGKNYRCKPRPHYSALYLPLLILHHAAESLSYFTKKIVSKAKKK